MVCLFVMFSLKENSRMTLCTIFKTFYLWVWDYVKLVFSQLFGWIQAVVWMVKPDNHGHKCSWRGLSYTIGRKTRFLSFGKHPDFFSCVQSIVSSALEERIFNTQISHYEIYFPFYQCFHLSMHLELTRIKGVYYIDKFQIGFNYQLF